MDFTSVIMPGEYSNYLDPVNNDANYLPIHSKCLELWKEIINEQQPLFCLICEKIENICEVTEQENDAMIHQDEGLLIHIKCLEILKKAQLPCLICDRLAETKGEALVRIAKQGDDVAIKAFIKNNQEIPLISYNLAVRIASLKGYDQVVETLLHTGLIENTDRDMALKYATENNHIETFKILNYASVPKNILKICLSIARENRCQGIIEQIPDNNEKRSKFGKVFKKISDRDRVVNLGLLFKNAS